MTHANRWRGEAALCLRGAEIRLRPSFSALAAAEEELGPLLALVERAADGNLRLGEMVALFWHCRGEREHWSREEFGEAVTAAGLVACAAPLRALIGQILQGGG